MDQPTGDLRTQLMGGNQSDGAVFKTVLFYSVLILLLPIGSFFVTKSIIFETLLGQQSTIGTNIVAAVVAVIVLHLALGLFIYKVRQYFMHFLKEILRRPTTKISRCTFKWLKKKNSFFPFLIKGAEANLYTFREKPAYRRYTDFFPHPLTRKAAL